MALTALVLSALGWVLVAELPGLLLLAALRPAAGALRNAALAPLVGTGLTMLVAETYDLLDVAIRARTVLPATFGLAVLVLVLARRASASVLSVRRESISTFDRAALVVAVVIGIVTWCLTIRSTSAVLPNTDGAHHALFAARIQRFASIDPKIALSGDLATGTPHSAYYPLALHVCAALIASITGASVSVVFTAGYVLAAAVLLPVGVFVLTRLLCPQTACVAGIAAILAVVFTWFPYGPITWGGIPTIIAMSQVPIGVDALLYRRSDGVPWRVGIAVGVAGYGLFQQHNSELVSVALYAVIVAAVTIKTMNEDERRALFVMWAVGAAVLAATVLPLVGQLVAGAQDSSGLQGNSVAGAMSGTRPTRLTPGSTGHVLALLFSPAVLVLTVVGLFVAHRRKVMRGWGWCFVATLALFVISVSEVRGLNVITAPWYRAAIRVSYSISFFEITYAALALVSLGSLAARWRPRLAIATPIVLLAVVAGFEIPQTLALSRLAYRHSSLIGADQRAAFTWLRHHVARGDRVLNDFSNGSGWMETLDRVTPVFATKPVANDTSDGGWGERWYLLRHAAALGSDARDRRAVQAWHVTYAYVDERHVDGTSPVALTVAGLSASSAYRLVWQRGPVSIYAVLPSR